MAEAGTGAAVGVEGGTSSGDAPPQLDSAANRTKATTTGQIRRGAPYQVAGGAGKSTSTSDTLFPTNPPRFCSCLKFNKLALSKLQQI